MQAFYAGMMALGQIKAVSIVGVPGQHRLLYVPRQCHGLAGPCHGVPVVAHPPGVEQQREAHCPLAAQRRLGHCKEPARRSGV